MKKLKKCQNLIASPFEATIDIVWKLIKDLIIFSSINNRFIDTKNEKLWFLYGLLTFEG